MKWLIYLLGVEGGFRKMNIFGGISYDEIVDILFGVIALVNYFGGHLYTFQGFF